MTATILIVDDEQNILTALARMLRVEGYESEVAGSGEIALEKLASLPIDLVMLDVMMPGGMGGLDTLRAIRDRFPHVPVVMMSGASSIETAIEAIRCGAQTFLEKPLANEKILIEIRNGLKLKSLAEENQVLRARLGKGHTLVGESAGMKAVYERVHRAAPTQSSVLITGESGTGKELVARAIHNQSQRAEASFIKLNCAAIPSELIESELFGHEKGAFTGATAQKKGKFELADGGTLFLDEIGDMRLEVQAKLLRVLQEGEIERVGGVRELKVDVRIIAATHQNLTEAIAEGRFREDLYYRINVIPVEVPPLREHLEDVPLLVNHFVGVVAEQNEQAPRDFSDAAIASLQRYSFPGNIRELRNLVERLVILSNQLVIDADDVEAITLSGTRPVRGGYVPGMAFKDLVDQAKRNILLAALEEHGENMTRTAESLRMERSNLYKVLRTLGIRQSEDNQGQGQE